jgi:hypothetical protein
MAPAINYSRRSPNYNDRPPGTIIDSLVIHTTEGVWPGDLDWLCSASSEVSCHYVLAPDGAIYSIVDDSMRAWHAGNSSYAGRSNYNNFSLGIEVSHQQGQAYKPAQHPALTALCAWLIDIYPINRTYLVQHRQVAPDRKIDMTNVSDAQFENWANAFYVPASRRFQIIAPCAIFTDRRPDAPLAEGPDFGMVWLEVNDVINVGQLKDGWLWVSPNEHEPPGIGFLPASYARPI